MTGCQGLVGEWLLPQLTCGFFTLMVAQCWPYHWLLFVFKQSDYQPSSVWLSIFDIICKNLPYSDNITIVIP